MSDLVKNPEDRLSGDIAQLFVQLRTLVGVCTWQKVFSQTNFFFYYFSGVHSVAYAFPKVKIVTTAVDKAVNDKFHILPGIGK